MEFPRTLLTIPHMRDVPFAQLTTLGLGGLCRWLFAPTCETQAQLFVKTCRANSLPYRVLGGGSNLLVLSDISAPTVRLDFEAGPRATSGGLWAPASCRQAALAGFAAGMGLTGLEWACGIPGSLGGAIRTNAGAQGSCWGQVLDCVRYLSPDGELLEKRPAPGDFAYRSGFPAEGSIVLSASAGLARGDAGSIKRRMGEFRLARQRSQPKGRSAGCVFKNPPGESAGRLIDMAGLKGARVGGAAVSDVHANFILNLGGATSGDYLSLMRTVQTRVFDAFGCRLEPEIEIWSEL